MFRPGDVVQLKSGGTPMTVVFAGDLVRCVWIGETFGAEEGTFPSEVLKPVAPEGKPRLVPPDKK
jgi:uncharacterized protein YodC (DUF2158 family)